MLNLDPEEEDIINGAVTATKKLPYPEQKRVVNVLEKIKGELLKNIDVMRLEEERQARVPANLQNPSMNAQTPRMDSPAFVGFLQPNKHILEDSSKHQLLHPGPAVNLEDDAEVTITATSGNPSDKDSVKEVPHIGPLLDQLESDGLVIDRRVVHAIKELRTQLDLILHANLH